MPVKPSYRDEHLAIWRQAWKHGGPFIMAIGIVLSFLYRWGFVDIPATREQVNAIDRRVTAVEAEQDGVSDRLRTIENTTSGMSQKVDDTKRNVDRLVDVLIDDGIARRGAKR